MMTFDFSWYRPADESAWDAFVQASRNGVFLFERSYMDYHTDRFLGASVMVRRSCDNELVAVLPAHEQTADGRRVLYSHGGLTFGGLVMHEKLGGSEVLLLMEGLLAWVGRQGFRKLIYRPVPHPYHRLPSEDDIYALHRLGARVTNVLLSSTLDLERDSPPSSRRKKHASNARKAGVVVVPCTLDEFWPVLVDTLRRRHGVDPVHSLQEMKALAARLRYIEAIGARVDSKRGDVVAGAVLYQYRGLLHAQYLASTEEGYRISAMNAVIEHAIRLAKDRGNRWFSLGASTEQGGRVLNDGLLAYKEQFGARSTLLHTYEVDTESHHA